MPFKGSRLTGRHAQGVERPHVWICGPDKNRHQMYIPWLRSRAQAKYRGEEWTLEFEHYFKVWDGFWDQRGRDSEQLCMTRIDWEGDWTPENVELVTRKAHCAKQKQWKSGYGKRGKDKQQRKSKGQRNG